jgi:tRNA pseudouridine55 synthase
MVDKIDFPIITFTVKCSKGTYVRTLCADIGAALGCGAHLQSLRRLQSDPFSLTNSYTISEIRTWDRDRLISHCLPLGQVMSLWHIN